MQRDVLNILRLYNQGACSNLVVLVVILETYFQFIRNMNCMSTHHLHSLVPNVFDRKTNPTLGGS